MKKQQDYVVQELRIEKIEIGGGTQPRAALDEGVVAEYCEVLKSGGELPPIRVFFDGSKYWLGDGFHRYHAHLVAGLAKIMCAVSPGQRRAAILYSVGANADHGLRRSNEDKRRAVLTLLRDDEWRTWSQEKIAQACRVSPALVSKIVHEEGEKPAVRTVERGGATYQQNTASIGKAVAFEPQKAAAPTAQKSSASLHGEEMRLKNEQPPADPDMPSTEEVMADMEAELKDLRAQVAAISADDPRHKLIELQQQLQVALRRQGELQDRTAELQRQLEWMGRQLKRIGKAVGEEDHTKIAATVEAKCRDMKAAA